MKTEAYVFITHPEEVHSPYVHGKIIELQFARTTGTIHNEPEAYIGLFGELVNTGLYYRDKPVFVQKALIEEIREKLDTKDYSGTGGGLQAVQWARNKKVIAEEILRRFPSVPYLTAWVWSGGDFDEGRLVKYSRR